jgi:hypothetical protein
MSSQRILNLYERGKTPSFDSYLEVTLRKFLSELHLISTRRAGLKTRIKID